MDIKNAMCCGVSAPWSDDMKCLHVKCKYEEPRGLSKSRETGANEISRQPSESEHWRDQNAGAFEKDGAIFNQRSAALSAQRQGYEDQRCNRSLTH